MKFLSSNKKVVMICVLLVIFCSFFLVYIQNEYFIKEKNIILKSDTETHIINSNAITMMYETASGSGEYETTTDTLWPREGYIFNERLSGCENGGTLSWNNETNKVIMESNTSDRCYVYFDVYIPNFVEYLLENIYVSDGVNELYYHDGVGTYTNADQEAGDNSYRYSGADPNNYVCFGSDAATCPDEYLYRIIGLFYDDKDGVYNVKLIKANSYGEYIWDDTGNLVWNKSIINTTLNELYYNDLPIKYQNLIKMMSWYVDSKPGLYTSFTKELYGREAIGITDSMKVGLMYLSDYGYAAYPDAWITTLNNYDTSTIKQNNWLYMEMGICEWTIFSAYVMYGVPFAVSIDSNNYKGRVHEIEAYQICHVRPVFYLISDITYASGSGTESDPIRIN